MSHKANDILVDNFLDYLDEYPLWCHFNVHACVLRVEHITTGD